MASYAGVTEAETEVITNYKLELDELTSNDIDDIKRLTIIAKDKDDMPEPERFAKAVVDTICAHILQAPKDLKMPPLYLLDSIAKNVGGAYVKFISERLVEVFSTAFNESDPSMHIVMEHLFRTWNNQKIFDQNLLLAIQRKVEFPSMKTDRPVDPGVPSGGDPPPTVRTTGGIHVNPMFLNQGGPGRGRGFMGLGGQEMIGWRHPGASDMMEGKEPHGSLPMSSRGFPRPLGRGEGRGFPPGVGSDRTGGFVGAREQLGNGPVSIDEFERRERLAHGARMRNGFAHPMEEGPGRPGQLMGRGGRRGGSERFWSPEEDDEMPDYSFEAELSRRVEVGRMAPRSLHGSGAPHAELRREHAASPPLGRILDAGPVANGEDKPEVPAWIKEIKERKARPAVPDWLKEKTAKVKATLAREAWEERTAGIEEEWSDGEDFGRRAPAPVPQMSAPPPPPGHPPRAPQGSTFLMTGPGMQRLPPPPPPLGLRPATMLPLGPPAMETLSVPGVAGGLSAPPFPPPLRPPRSSAPPIPQGPPPVGARSAAPPPQPTPTRPPPPGFPVMPAGLPPNHTLVDNPRPPQMPAPPLPTPMDIAPPPEAIKASATAVMQQPAAASVPSAPVSETQATDRQAAASQTSQQNLLQQLLQQATQLVASSAAAAAQGQPQSSAAPTAAQANTLAALLQLIPSPISHAQPSPTPPTSTTTQLGPPSHTPPLQDSGTLSAAKPPLAQPQAQPVHVAPAPTRPPLMQPPLPPGPPPAQARGPSPPTAPRPATMTPLPLPTAAAPAPTPQTPSQNLVSGPTPPPMSSSSAPAQPPLPPGAPPLATILAGVVPPPTTTSSAPPLAPAPTTPSSSSGTTESAILTQNLLSSLVSFGLISAPAASAPGKPATPPLPQTALMLPPSVSPPPQPLTRLSAPLPVQPAPAPPGPSQQPIGSAPQSGSVSRPPAMMPMQPHMPAMPMQPPGMPLMNGMGMHPMGMAPMGAMPMPGMYPMQSMPYQPSHMPMPGHSMQHYMPHHRMQPGMRPMPGYGPPMHGQPAPPPGLPGMPIPGGPNQRQATPVAREMNEVGREFKMDELRVRHESVIRALYTDFSYHCKSCSRRFHTQAEYAQHLDWHFKENQKRKAQKTTSRRWFANVEEWLSGTGAKSAEAAPSFFADLSVTKPKEEEENTAVPADEQKECTLCGEEFEVFFSADADEWMYKGTVYLNAPANGITADMDRESLGPIVHAKCRSLDVATAARQDGAVDEQRGERRGGDGTGGGLSEQFHAGNGYRKKVYIHEKQDAVASYTHPMEGLALSARRLVDRTAVCGLVACADILGSHPLNVNDLCAPPLKHSLFLHVPLSLSVLACVLSSCM